LRAHGGTFDGPYELKKVFESEPNASLHFGVPGINLKSIFDFVELVLHESKNHAIPRALAYAQVGVLDLSRSRKFYDQVLGLLDMKPLFHRPTNIIYGKTNLNFSSVLNRSRMSLYRLATLPMWGFGPTRLRLWTLFTKKPSLVVAQVCRPPGSKTATSTPAL